MKKIIYLVLVILWMSMIFFLSSQEKDESSNLSNGFIANTIGNVYKIFDNNVSNEKLDEIKEIYSFPVRKVAHVTIYLILGILVFLFISQYDISLKDMIMFSLLVCIVYSIGDEIHQAFVAGRSGELRDVILDSLGSSIGIFFILRFKYKNIK